jgi:hypothetical protein
MYKIEWPEVKYSKLTHSRIGTIDLSRNRLTKVDFQMFADLRYAELINLAENQVREINRNTSTDLRPKIWSSEPVDLSKIWSIEPVDQSKIWSIEPVKIWSIRPVHLSKLNTVWPVHPFSRFISRKFEQIYKSKLWTVHLSKFYKLGPCKRIQIKLIFAQRLLKSWNFK